MAIYFCFSSLVTFDQKQIKEMTQIQYCFVFFCITFTYDYFGMFEVKCNMMFRKRVLGLHTNTHLLLWCIVKK